MTMAPSIAFMASAPATILTSIEPGSPPRLGAAPTIRVRSGKGLGDSLYLRAIVDHLVAAGNRVIPLSNYPDVFIGSGTRVEPFTRKGECRIAHYTERMADQSITQWGSMLRRAGLPDDVPLRFSWTIQNRRFVDDLRTKAAGRRIIVVHGGRQPMQRADGYGIELMPSREAFACALDALDDCYRVRVGNAAHLYPLPVDSDLNEQTSVADLLDLASISDGIVAQCSFAVPLAEVFDRPLLAIWAAAGLQSHTAYVRTITPRKVLSKASSRYVMDDASAELIAEAARALRHI